MSSRADSLTLRLARPDEHGALEELQRRASLELPDYRDELLLNPDAIYLPEGQIANGQVIVAEFGGRRRSRRWEGANDEQAIGGQPGEPGTHEVPQPPGHAVAHHRLPDGLAHHEPGARRGGPVRPVQVHNQASAAPAVTTSDDGRELVPVRQPGCGRQHRDPAIRRRAARGPCRDGRR